MLAGANQISVLNPAGVERVRFPEPANNAREEIPYDVPLYAAFDGTGRLLVTNWAPANPAHQAILSAYTAAIADTFFV